MAQAGVQVDRAPRVGERFYYGWVVLGATGVIGTLALPPQCLGSHRAAAARPGTASSSADQPCWPR